LIGQAVFFFRQQDSTGFQNERIAIRSFRKSVLLCDGNQVQRNVGSTVTLTYNHDNQLTATSGGATASFVYDGDGNRVKGTVAGVTTTYVGAHYEVEGATTRKYYYLGGQRVAMLENSTVYYLLGDHLGSTALTVNSAVFCSLRSEKKAEIIN
jgi:hypothetical protein